MASVVEELSAANDALRSRVAELEKALADSRRSTNTRSSNDDIRDSEPSSQKSNASFTKRQVARYSRQLLMPDIGVQGQKRLAAASVLLVGAGGLGSSAAMYLAGAGIGRIGLVDFDVVELNNLHRQIIHTEDRIGMPKVESAKIAMNRFNSDVECITYGTGINRENAVSLVKQYDIVVDGSDNAPTRYLVNDACVVAGKPLVSGSALQMEGQLTVYNYDSGPCYRCLFPTPPPPAMVRNCADGGVLGVVPGIIGCLEALEAIKLAAQIGNIMARRLMLFDALDNTFRTVKLRGRDPKCVVCGDTPTVRDPSTFDYESFCGGTCLGRVEASKMIDLLDPRRRISVEDYKKIRDDKTKHLLLDVRPRLQFDICSLPNSTNIPFADLKTRVDDVRRAMTGDNDGGIHEPVYVLCRRGNDSQRAAKLLLDSGLNDVFSIDGGIAGWARQVDPELPIY
mmetsp:Transcript_19533/g.32015  ORF Transcript_19533/g.32015 Transcript_19533/m.32015 type:complete len:454 (-) Transcript_19533:620-1981(-)